MVPFLAPLLGSVAAKVGDALVGELLRAWGLDKARRKLERHLAAVQCIMLDAEAKSRTNPAVRQWMTDLKTAAYQADDILDAFRCEALRRRAAHIRHSTARKALSYFTVNSPVVFRLSMSRKMKDALEMIDELVVEMNNFHFLQLTETPTIDHPQTHSHVDESDIVGRQDEKEQVVKILLDHADNNNKNNNVMVLPIVGMGGIGKTTLAQLVHNDPRVMHHFELVIWVCVSDKFVIEEIIRSIIQVVTMNKCELTEMEALEKKLGEVLGKKRCLLVLDDVWNEDRQKWDEMRSLLCSHVGSGSAIIVTSRSDRVASIMGTLPPHMIFVLNEDQSWELFRRSTFGSGVEKQGELISVAKSILHKCKGLPLAIKTISALLQSKHHTQWFSVLDSDVWKDDIITSTGIVPALQLSYYNLSSEAKTCFSFCAIFPKDSMLEKDTLIQLWMANDFIASEARGEHIFDVLVWRCFLQDVETQKKLRPELRYGNFHSVQDEFIHQPTTCKMHDLIHDLAEFVSGNDCSILQQSSSCQENSSSLQNEVRHLSLEYVTDNTMAAMKEILAPLPRTILIQRYLKRTMNLPSIVWSKFLSVRAFKTFSIETNMTNLKHLRYLDCSYSSISSLPEATTMLYSLKTLKLIGCQKLEKLPKGMGCMISLWHVFLVGCHRLEHMPRGIGQLNSLRTLTSYVIDSDASRGIVQLKNLNLGGALSLSGIRKVHSAENAKQGNMSAKHNLKRLSLDWYGSYSTNIGFELDTNPEGILEALCPGKRLEALQLCNYTGAKLSTWMHNSTLLENLSELSLSSCQNCKDLPPLWQLPSLVYLRLSALVSLTSICLGNDDTGTGESCNSSPPFFPKLETMILSYIPKLERWHWEVAGQVVVMSFPRLKKIEISRCPMLASMPKMPSLRYLSLDSLGSLTSICVGNNDTNNVESCISPPHFFPKLETMIVSNMPKLERWHQEVAGQVAVVSFPQLKKLSISECPMLASMPKMIPLLDDLLVNEARDIPLYHLMNLSVQSNLKCKGSIKMKRRVGWLHEDLHFSRIGNSNVSLLLTGLSGNVERFQEELSKIPSRFIKELGIENCDCLFSSEASEIQQNIWKHFGFVERMWISSINNIIQWPLVEFRNLNCLRSLHLLDCSNLTGSLPSTISDEENFQHPRLQNHLVINCGKWLEVPKLPSSLETLHIARCPKLVSMPRNLWNMTKLREIFVMDCATLTTFPDGMYGVTALKKLDIWKCPRLETLPEGLLQQLPALEQLTIKDCPNLKGAFSRGGVYWNLVKSIRHRLV
ncbi:hypothetical protein VPH35_070700 [Triticum aestivum]